MKKKQNHDDHLSSYVDRSRNIAVNLGILELKTDFKRRNRINLVRRKFETIIHQKKKNCCRRTARVQREAEYHACRRQTREANSCLQLGMLRYLMCPSPAPL